MKCDDYLNSNHEKLKLLIFKRWKIANFKKKKNKSLRITKMML